MIVTTTSTLDPDAVASESESESDDESGILDTYPFHHLTLPALTTLDIGHTDNINEDTRRSFRALAPIMPQLQSVYLNRVDAALVIHLLRAGTSLLFLKISGMILHHDTTAMDLGLALGRLKLGALEYGTTMLPDRTDWQEHLSDLGCLLRLALKHKPLQWGSFGVRSVGIASKELRLRPSNVAHYGDPDPADNVAQRLEGWSRIRLFYGRRFRERGIELTVGNEEEAEEDEMFFDEEMWGEESEKEEQSEEKDHEDYYFDDQFDYDHDQF